MRRPAPDLTPRPAGRKRATGARPPRGGPRNVSPQLKADLVATAKGMGAASPVASDNPVAMTLRSRCAKKMGKLEERILVLIEKQTALGLQQVELEAELVTALADLED